MKKYYANFNANNGTRLIHDIEYANKAAAIKEIRAMAEGERYQGNECSWWVKDEDDNYIARGGRSDCGRYRTDERDL